MGHWDLASPFKSGGSRDDGAGTIDFKKKVLNLPDNAST